MKIKLAYGVNALSGKKDGVVYVFNPKDGTTYSKRYVIPKESVSNQNFKAIQKNIWKLHPSEGYKNDLRAYIEAYNRTKPKRIAPFARWTNLYQVLLYEMQRQMPEQVNLSTLTRLQIYAEQLPCLSVARAVESGVLIEVPGWEGFNYEL
jgi:hypothetical protein